MVDIRVGMYQQPAPFVRVRCEILQHVFVHFLLEVDAHGTITANHFIGANSRVGGNVSARVPNMDIRGDVADRVMRALNGGDDQPARELRPRSQRSWRTWRQTP